MDKKKLIDEEVKKLKKLFANVPSDKLQVLDRLINQVAFMTVTLDELQQLINDNGSIELFKNGTQEMNREYPAVKSYNTTIKNYMSCIKQLMEYLNVDDKNKVNNELLQFLKK